MVGTASSPVRALSHLQPGHPSGPNEPSVRRRTHGGNEGMHTEYHGCNLYHDGRSVRERHNLRIEGPGPKAFESNVREACFSKHFWAPNTIVKYDGKTNPSVWLQDYQLMRRVVGVDNDLFIIKLLPIYLANTSRAWIDHLRRNSIDCWEDLKEIFTGNFQGTYIQPSKSMGSDGLLAEARGISAGLHPVFLPKVP
jgi:hypothetical protein